MPITRMKISLLKSELLSGIQLVQTAAEKKTTMPILANVLLTASEGLLTIASTDLEITSVATLKADVKTRGSTTVNAKVFLEIIRELPEGEVQISVGEGERVDITCQRSKFKMNGVASDEYPGLPGINLETKGRITASELSEMIEKTIYAVSTDDTRYTLGGVCFESVDGSKKGKKLLRLVATDGHRLSLINRSTDGISLSEKAIVPRRGLLELKKLLDSTQEPQISMVISEGFLVAQSEKYRLAVRLIEGEFPDYAQVIPEGAGTILTLNTEEFTQALRRAMLVATDKTKFVRLDISKEGVKILSSSAELGEAKEDITATYSGKEVSMGFNARYMLDFLSSVGSAKEISIELHGELGPGKFYLDEDEGYLAIIMPMRLPS